MRLNFRETPDQKVYISSDFHLGHQRDFVWKARGYNTWQEHDEGVIEMTNAVVRPNDILIFLGDWSLNTTLAQFNEQLSRIKCQNIFTLWGNHNNPQEKNIFIPGMPKETVRGIAVEKYPFEYRNMVFLPNYVEAILNGQFVVLQHYPIYVWNEMAHGAWMLCGHSHYGCDMTKADAQYGKILDVGWDGHGAPWSMDEIKKVMDAKQFVAVDHHHPSKVSA